MFCCNCKDNAFIFPIKVKRDTNYEAPPTYPGFALAHNKSISRAPGQQAAVTGPGSQAFTIRFEGLPGTQPFPPEVERGAIPGKVMDLLPQVNLSDFLAEVENRTGVNVRQYEATLKDEGLETYLLPGLSDADWLQLGVRIGHKMLLKKEAEKYRSPS